MIEFLGRAASLLARNLSENASLIHKASPSVRLRTSAFLLPLFRKEISFRAVAFDGRSDGTRPLSQTTTGVSP